MTGMVPMVATLLSLPSGRAKSAAGRPNSQSGEAFNTVYPTRNGREILPVFTQKRICKMKNLHHFPLGISREDFDSEADYQYALEHYDELYNEAEDLAMEDYYEKKHRND